ncbi:hypothetical protein [Streptomyces botrytidirepellens]|uniref:Uncharacterized protein n=1 Tax=Streptomyces botrytidirepellens TaxID=2486417 RepID=A0A3M8WQ23_9ACTN|nr:hypothetical protein [Streptomyces botrytidirepellens]RNG31350.1 hypothetical protein EEJ42_08875 [Streptomyces botrytidirepellens]
MSPRPRPCLRLPRSLWRLAAGLASYRQAIDSIVWTCARIDRCPHCHRRGVDGCDPATGPHPSPATPGRLRRAAHTARLAWHLRHTLPAHLNQPFANTPTTPADAPF